MCVYPPDDKRRDIFKFIIFSPLWRICNSKENSSLCTKVHEVEFWWTFRAEVHSLAICPGKRLWKCIAGFVRQNHCLWSFIRTNFTYHKMSHRVIKAYTKLFRCCKHYSILCDILYYSFVVHQPIYQRKFPQLNLRNFHLQHKCIGNMKLSRSGKHWKTRNRSPLSYFLCNSISDMPNIFVILYKALNLCMDFGLRLKRAYYSRLLCDFVVFFMRFYDESTFLSFNIFRNSTITFLLLFWVYIFVCGSNILWELFEAKGTEENWFSFFVRQSL